MTTTPVHATSGGEPSDAAWRRSGDVAARIMENLAERDALARGNEMATLREIQAASTPHDETQDH